MENKMLRELQGLLEDINENEIVSHTYWTGHLSLG